MEQDNFEKSCFIITPIGNESDPIRRHIDGILNTVIEPLLNEKGYDLVVAHRITAPGSINKQVISGIYNADLVIANLTNLNPNVMYELAFSHSIGKPTITIAESGTTKLPFDITTERTIFYKNDFMGVVELKEQLGSMIESIEKNPDSEEIDNPIYTWLDKSIYENKLVKTIEDKKKSEGVNETDLFKYIIEKLDRLESYIEPKYNKITNDIIINLPSEIPTKDDEFNEFYKYFRKKLIDSNIKLKNIYKIDDNTVVTIEGNSADSREKVYSIVNSIIKQFLRDRLK